MYVIDLEDNEYALQATSTNEGGLEGNQSFSAIILPTKVNSLFIDKIDKMWNVVDHDNVEHKITYCKKQGVGDKLTVDIRARPLFYDVLDNDRIYERYDEHMTPQVAFTRIFANTGFTFVLVDSFIAVEWEGFGDGETKLESFKRALNRYKAEFRIVGNTVYLEKMIGRDTNIMYRHKLNASNIIKEVDANQMWTYARGYGDYGDGDGGEDWEDAKLQREYTSPLASIIGKRHAPPIKDGRVKIASEMDKSLKELVDESLKVSVSANIHDLRKQNYPIGQSELGDRVFLIDGRIGLNEEIRVVHQSITRNWKGKIIDINITFGEVGIAKRYQSNINTAVKNINDVFEGKKRISMSFLDERIQEISNIINGNVDSVFRYMPNGIVGWNGDNPNYMTRYVGDAIGFSTDGGKTYRTAMSAELGIVADYIYTGTLKSIMIDSVEIHGSYIEGSTIVSKKSDDDYIKLEGSVLDSHGLHDMTWIGQTGKDRVTIGFRNGQLRARNHTKEWSLFFNDYGISTFADGDGTGYPGGNASGAIEFHSYRYSGGQFRGMTLMSYGRTAIESSNENGARIYLNPNGASVRISDYDDNYYNIAAAAFNQSSRTNQKRDIKDLQDDALALIRSLNIKEYKRLTGGQETIFDQWQAGILVEESPLQLLADPDSVDIYTYLNYVARSVQQLADIIDGSA